MLSPKLNPYTLLESIFGANNFFIWCIAPNLELAAISYAQLQKNSSAAQGVASCVSLRKVTDRQRDGGGIALPELHSSSAGLN